MDAYANHPDKGTSAGTELLLATIDLKLTYPFSL
jgi:hypothetical protein